jgi:hypothetical protein
MHATTSVAAHDHSEESIFGLSFVRRARKLELWEHMWINFKTQGDFG